LNKKACFGVLTLAFLILVTTLFAVTVHAVVTQRYRASYFSSAIGECVILSEAVLGPGQPETYVGRGTMILGGFAEVEEFPPCESIPYPYYVTYDSAKAYGGVNVRWEGHMISVSLYSKSDVCGCFVDEGGMSDLFTVGVFPGDPDWVNPQMLSFEGVYRDSAGTRVVNGKAGVATFLIGPQPGVIMTIVALFEADNSPLMSLLWVQENSEVFLHYVKITTLS